MTIYTIAGLSGLLSDAEYALSTQDDGTTADERIRFAIASALVAAVDEPKEISNQSGADVAQLLRALVEAIHKNNG